MIESERVGIERAQVVDDPWMSTELWLSLNDAPPEGELVVEAAWDGAKPETLPVEFREPLVSRVVTRFLESLPQGRIAVHLRLQTVAPARRGRKVEWAGRWWDV